MKNYLNSHFPTNSLRDVIDGKTFYVPTFGLTLIHVNDEQGIIVLFPENSVFFNVPQNEVDIGFIECKKEGKNIILFQEQDFSEKKFILFHRNFFKRINIQDPETFKIKVNLKIEGNGLTLLKNTSNELSYVEHLKLLSEPELESEIETLKSFEDYEKMVLVRDEIASRN